MFPKKKERKNEEKERRGEKRKNRLRKKRRGRSEREKGTSRPKARDGHRYPCPAKRFVYGGLLGKQGFGPEGGQSLVGHRRNQYVRPSVHLSILPGDGSGFSGAGPSLWGAGSNHPVAVSGLS